MPASSGACRTTRPNAAAVAGSKLVEPGGLPRLSGGWGRVVIHLGFPESFYLDHVIKNADRTGFVTASAHRGSLPTTHSFSSVARPTTHLSDVSAPPAAS